MLAHEKSERRWLAGERKALEVEWVRADRIASIAAGLIPAPVVAERLDQMRNGRGGGEAAQA